MLKEYVKKINDLKIERRDIELDIPDGTTIVYGYSDDGMVFEGDIDGNVDCYDGGTAYIVNNSYGFDLANNECDDDECPYFTKLLKNAIKIKAIWDEDYEAIWRYETKIPHEKIMFYEDGEPWCEAIIFETKDLNTTERG